MEFGFSPSSTHSLSPSLKTQSVIWPVEWTARGLLGGLMKEWDDVTILLLLFYPGTVADRSEWLARCSVSFILYLGQLQHTFPPHNNLCSTPLLPFFKKENTGLFIYQMFSSIFSQTSFCPKCDPAWWFTKPRSVLMKYSVCASLWQTFTKSECSPLMRFGRNRPESQGYWRYWREMVRQEMTPQWEGHSQELDFSPPLTLIRSHNIRMCDDDLHQQICMRPNVVLALCRKCEKHSHRKALFASVRAIWRTRREDLFLSNFDMVGTARVSTIRVGPNRHGNTFLVLCVCVQVLLLLGFTVPLSNGSSLRQLLHLSLLHVTYISWPEFLLCKCETCVLYGPSTRLAIDGAASAALICFL